MWFVLLYGGCYRAGKKKIEKAINNNNNNPVLRGRSVVLIYIKINSVPMVSRSSRRLLYIRNNLYAHVYIIYDGLWRNGLSVDNLYRNNVKRINSCRQTWTFLSRDTRNTCSRDVTLYLDGENRNSFSAPLSIGSAANLFKKQKKKFIRTA